MSRSVFSLFTAAACTFLLGMTGCSEAPATTTDAGNRAAEGAVQASHEGHDHAHDGHDHGTASASSEIEVALAKLSAEDRAAAEAQKICPVSDHALGSMDAPVKIHVDGQDVWVCCQGCEDPLKADPAKYLAKLKK